MKVFHVTYPTGGNHLLASFLTHSVLVWAEDKGQARRFLHAAKYTEGGDVPNMKDIEAFPLDAIGNEPRIVSESPADLIPFWTGEKDR